MTAAATTFPQVGDPAPEFMLPSTADEDVTLSSLRGQSNVVLAFFPLAFTSVCTAEMCAFTDDADRFQAHDTRLWGISVDSIPALKEFKVKHGITVDLLSDLKHDVCRRYGTLMEDTGFSRRAYVIVDRAGIVRWAYTEAELGHKRDNAELLGHIEALALTP